jgi:hypothetical protein
MSGFSFRIFFDILVRNFCVRGASIKAVCHGEKAWRGKDADKAGKIF